MIVNCAPLNVKTLRGLTDQSLSKNGRMIIRKYNNNDNEVLHKQIYKQTKFQEHSRIKGGVE